MKFVLALLLLVLPFAAEAGLWQRCQALFSKVEAPLLAPEEEVLWRVSFGPNGTHPYFSRLNHAESEELFWHAYGKLPAEVRARLELLHGDIKEANQLFNRWFKDPLPSSFLAQILRRSTRGTDLGAGFAAHQDRLAADPSALARLEGEFADLLQASKAHHQWVHGEAGAAVLPHVKKGGKQYFVVNGQEVEATFDSKEWTLLVPKYLMKHAAWNPVAPEKVIQMAQAGVKPPKSYRAAIGHDGFFYPDDGNHRLNLDARKLIPVKISDPPRTLSLRLMFDYAGIPQPGSEKIRAYIEGKISWEALLPNKDARRHFAIPPPRP